LNRNAHYNPSTLRDSFAVIWKQKWRALAGKDDERLGGADALAAILADRS
jgi:hypothetical protein